jgi:hypothetical protein
MSLARTAPSPDPGRSRGLVDLAPALPVTHLRHDILQLSLIFGLASLIDCPLRQACFSQSAENAHDRPSPSSSLVGRARHAVQVTTVTASAVNVSVIHAMPRPWRDGRSVSPRTAGSHDIRGPVAGARRTSTERTCHAPSHRHARSRRAAQARQNSVLVGARDGLGTLRRLLCVTKSCQGRSLVRDDLDEFCHDHARPPHPGAPGPATGGAERLSAPPRQPAKRPVSKSARRTPQSQLCSGPPSATVVSGGPVSGRAGPPPWGSPAAAPSEGVAMGAEAPAVPTAPPAAPRP